MKDTLPDDEVDEETNSSRSEQKTGRAAEDGVDQVQQDGGSVADDKSEPA